MNKRVMSWILIISMMLTQFGFMPTTVSASPLNASENETPKFTYIPYSDWSGNIPKVEDSVFRIEVEGTNLYELTAEVATYNDSEYTAVASQTNRWFLGKTATGKERYIYEMTVDGLNKLIYTTYYVRLKDSNGTYYDDRNAYFGCTNELNIYVDVNNMPDEISTGSSTVPFEINLNGADGNVNKDNLTLKLYSGTKEGFWSNPSLKSLIATTEDDDYEITVTGGGQYRLKGVFQVTSQPISGDTLYMEIDYSGNKSYTGKPIYVIHETELGQFKLSNAFAGRDPSEGQHESMGTEYQGVDNATFYIGKTTTSSATSAHKFSLTGGNLSNKSLLTVTDNNGISIVRSGTIKVTGPVSGIYTATGTIDIPSTSTSIVFSYNGSSVHTVPIKSTKEQGSVSLTPVAYKMKNGTYLLPANTTDFEVALSGVNLPTSSTSYSAILGEDVINCDVESSDGELVLKLTSTVPQNDLQWLTILLDGEKLYNLRYEEGTGVIPNLGSSCVINIVFGDFFNIDEDTIVPPALTGIVGNRDLTLYGNGFNSNKNYTAHFIEHTINGLSATPRQLSATYVSSSKLLISKTLTDSLSRGWYDVYLKEDGTQINGFYKAVLLPTEDVASIINPTVKINDNGTYTTEKQITINMTQGSFTDVRFSEDQTGLSYMSYSNITNSVSYTLSDGYGNKTIYFEFKNSEGNTYSTTASISYRSTIIQRPSLCGIMGIAGDEPLLINKFAQYSLYIQAGGVGNIGKAELLDDYGNVINTYTLNRTAGTEVLYTYSKLINFDNSSVKELRFYLIDSFGFNSEYTDIAVNVVETPFITSYRTDIATNYLGITRYADGKSDIQYTIRGKSDHLAIATLKYTDAANTEKNSVVTLTEKANGVYTAKESIPNDAAKLLSIEYKLTDPNVSSNYILKIEEKQLPVSSTAIFSGLPNTGDFDGKYLKIYTLNGRMQTITIGAGQTNFNFNTLVPSEYNYSLYDAFKTYKSGQFEAVSGVGTTVDLSDTLNPANITFNISGGTLSTNAYIRFSYISDNNTYYDYASPNVPKSGLYEGMIINSYELILPYNDLKIYNAPATVTTPISLNAGANSQSLTLSPLSTVTLTINVNDSNVDGRVIPETTVSAMQSVVNGSAYFYYNTSGVTDDNGQVKLNLYADSEARIEATKDNYNKKDMSLDITNDVSQNANIMLTYSDQNRVKINSYSRPLQSHNEKYDDTQFLENNNSISYVNATDIDGNYINAYINNSWLKFANDRINQTVRIYPHMVNGFVNENEFYTVKLDEYGNGAINVVAIPKGIITADITKIDDNSPASYMLIYNTAGNRVATVIDANGRLSSAPYNLNEGQYTAIIFSGYDLTDLSGLSNIDVIESYGLIENVHYARKNVTIENGKTKYLGEITLSSLVTKDMLFQYTVNFETKYLPASADGKSGKIYVKAKVFVNELLKNRLLLKSITAYNDSYRPVYDKAINGVSSDFGNQNYTPDADGNYTITFTTDITPGKLQNSTALSLSIELNGDTKSSMFYKTTDTPQVSIIVPKQVIKPKSEITVRGIAFVGSTVDIYDGETLIGTTKANNKHSYSAVVTLLAPEKNAVHTLTAKMTIPNSEIFTSNPAYCEIIDSDSRATISNYQFSNVAHVRTLDDPSIKKYNVSTLGNTPGGIYAYYPNGLSRVSFRINKLVSSQLENVYVINTDTSGLKTKYPAKLVEDDPNGKYSDWSMEAILGQKINNLSVFYSLKDGEDIGMLTGFHSPTEEQFTRALSNIDKIEPANIAPSYRDPNSAIITEQTATSLKAHKNFGDGKIGIEVDYTNVSGYTAEQLIAQGFRKIPVGSAGEYYLIKDSSSTSGYNLRATRTMYLSEGLASAITSGTLAENSIKNVQSLVDASLYETFASLNPILYADAVSSKGDNVRNIVGKVDYVGYLENTGEIAYEAFRNRTTDLGKLGTGLQVIGGAATAVQIFSGPASIDPANLKVLAEKIKDSKVRSRIIDEIWEYQYARRDSHSISSLMGVVSYGSSFFSLPGKCLSYVVSTGSMVFSQKIDAEYNLWGNGIIAQITMQLRKEGEDIGEEDDPDDPQWLMDPSGYVFEAIDNQRVEGITATAQTDESGNWSAWNNDALIASEQENPQTTDEKGKYGWDVPVGNWRVIFEDPSNKYQSALSKSMTVPPAHTEVNIGLLSTEQPHVLSATVDQTGLEIEFSKYMQAESIYDSDINLVNVQVFETIGNESVPCSSIDFIVSAENKGYKANSIYQDDEISSNTFVKRVRFNADTSLYPGGFKLFEDDGTTQKQYTVIVSGNVLSYSGVSLGSDFTKNDILSTARQTVAEPSSNINGGSYTQSQIIKLQTSTDGVEIYYTTNNTTPTTNSTKYKAPFTISESCILKAIASKVGMDNSNEFSAEYAIGTVTPLMASMPIASPAGGTYSTAQEVSLSTKTEGAKIYYSLDGTTPTSSSMQYLLPIKISATTTLKAIAVKDGYKNSSILTEVYTITSGSGSSGGGSSQNPTPVPEISQVTTYKDVSINDWYYDSINFVVEKKLFKGISDDLFAPNDNITRAMLITVLYRLAGSPNVQGTSFKDVEPSSWYENAIIWASQNDIVSGFGNGMLGPKDNITREQMAVILYRYAKLKGYDVSVPTDTTNFTDSDKISPWATTSINWMVANGMLNGKLNNTLDPTGNATRAEVATIFHRFFENIIK